MGPGATNPVFHSCKSGNLIHSSSSLLAMRHLLSMFRASTLLMACLLIHSVHCSIEPIKVVTATSNFLPYLLHRHLFLHVINSSVILDPQLSKYDSAFGTISTQLQVSDAKICRLDNSISENRQWLSLHFPSLITSSSNVLFWFDGQSFKWRKYGFYSVNDHMLHINSAFDSAGVIPMVLLK